MPNNKSLFLFYYFKALPSCCLNISSFCLHPDCQATVRYFLHSIRMTDFLGFMSAVVIVLII